ncbi:hypothetical protein FOF52_20215 [Thermobifida alba]|uniref:Uncharacterized protein n=1 Tax=Thermobifida alba TaxID=53522 RepID=A0ABY4L5L2_THEAE|nr:hypothetical protein [Thermobifida alba]UPT22981.1 hypothetical protein FOF52_20215 [Thermobifida alba]
MSKKQGLHGWRAFLVIVFSGGLAGVLFVAVAFGGVRSLLSSETSLSSSGGGVGGNSVEPRKPRESIAPGVIDLCEIVEGKGLMSASSMNRVDSRKFYRDGNDLEFGVRTVVDDCTWEVVGTGGHLWDLNLSYVAFIEDGEDSSKEDMSRMEFERRVERASDLFLSISSESGSIGNGEWFAYGEFDEEVDGYVAVQEVKSGIFEIRISGREGIPVLEKDFKTAVGKAAPHLVGAFTAQIPD